MKVIVTGGTGFIGNHVINELLHQNVEVIATGTNIKKARALPWFNEVEFVELDITTKNSDVLFNKISSNDKLLHLAWSGLPNYKSPVHFEKNLMAQYFFLKDIVNSGIKDVTVTGTCFEYGKKEGVLNEDMLTDPDNAYSIAKDTLHKFLKQLQLQKEFNLKWARLFYMFGPGQAPSSILAQLDKAIDNKESQFNMSAGEQVRDYLNVTEMASKLSTIVLNDRFHGTINCCSGNGITIKALVESHLIKRNSELKLNLGYYPYNDYEAFAFWGDNTKWNSIFA
jgi:nucleoside-diphosphate-sugar epimerase